MSVLKCKMCGGTLEMNSSETVAICEYCGTKQTLPKANSEVITNLFNRANNLRLKCEFDKAISIYEKIVEQDATEAEAYWGMVLCRYGIEYVEDSITLERIPTCHRTHYEAVTSDVDYQAAILHADYEQRMLYEAEATVIDNIQKEILNIVKDEKPFDVFICYKETDEVGKRTIDSVIANDIYHELTEEGFKVFYAAITLESKLGREYEPYIFAAINTAKVMLVIGTQPEYFESVWVKNEWGRFLKLMKNDRSKLLIPCYKDMDAYELPEEFAHFQAQDMRKIGFINDVIRGIKKVLSENQVDQRGEQKVVINTPVANEEPLLKRAFMFLEDGEFVRADELCEQVLNINPENAKAYLGKLMAELKVKKKEGLGNCDELFDAKNNYKKVLRFADESLVLELNNYIAKIHQRNKDAEIKKTYARANVAMVANTIPKLWEAIDLYKEVLGFRDSREKILVCEKRIAELRKEQEEKHKNDAYSEALSAMNTDYIPEIERAISLFKTIIDWQDSQEKIAQCKAKIEKLHIKAETMAKRGKMVGVVFATVLSGAIFIGILFSKVIIPSNNYNRAIDLMNSKEYEEAITIFENLKNYKKSKLFTDDCKYKLALELLDKDEYIQATSIFMTISHYKDSKQFIKEHINKCKNVISTGLEDYTVGCRSDGTVVATGNNEYGQCNVSTWNDIIAISAEGINTIGLKSDGTVVATGSNKFGQCDVEDWTNIVAISAGRLYTVGLKSDGTVLATGANSYGECDVSSWQNIVAISTGFDHTVGLKEDGTVIATGTNRGNQCDVSDWTDIVSVSAGAFYTVGLKADGTVVATGNDVEEELNKVLEWTDIVALSTGRYHIAGLKSNGTVVCTRWDDVSNWTDIVAISVGCNHIIGLKSDGSVLAIGDNSQGQCNVEQWNLFK